ncbi:hypothetical protein [Reyranella sp. CPCC 100927]|uniref:hypothetical protein n=1 Tax=Reyranella sp. CPCC 100927 TaxID=2599616 RepID=UPI0011B3B73A|nr:hypothetical protein [Reyranella sp. CPCC 100927]TWT14876.1 hypothetical protein FQU96_00470 [Reyranella sp. CPCC 100927]
MRVRDVGTDLMVDDHPTLDRWVGIFNFAIAGFCVYIAYDNYRPGGEWRDMLLLLVMPFAGLIALLGLWRAVARPDTRLHVDGAQGVVSLVRRTVLHRTTSRWTAAEITGFARAQRPGRDGELVYRLRLDLADGTSLPAATLWNPDRIAIDTVIARAHVLLGK